MLIVPIEMTIIIALIAYKRFGEGGMNEPFLWGIIPMWLMCIVVILSDLGYIFPK